MEPANRQPVKFQFKNIGPVNQAELELGDLTIIAGRNNTGKTYLVYTLYGFLKAWNRWPEVEFFLDKVIQKTPGDETLTIAGLAQKAITEGQAKRRFELTTFNQERKVLIEWLTHDFSEMGIPRVFGSSSENFAKSSIKIELCDLSPAEKKLPEATPQSEGTLSIQYTDDNLVITIIKGKSIRHSTSEIRSLLTDLYLRFLFPEFSLDPFVLCAERLSIALFYKELDFTKNQLVNLLQQLGDDKNKKPSFPFFLIDKTASRYALPIKDNIDYTRSIPELKGRESEIPRKQIVQRHQRFHELGTTKPQGTISKFKSTVRKEGRFSIPLHLASASARGLSDLYFFLRHVARRNHLLIIDEPESHLDTTNQILLARLLARLVRTGVKVLITTHSDYLVKEFNNLIMLSNSFEDKDNVMKRLGYKKDDFLEQASIRAYVAGT